MKKFTLIELMVVVAIIGILASLLLPALGKSRKSAQGAVCIGNLKQQGIAYQMFSDDNDFVQGTKYDNTLNSTTLAGHALWKLKLSFYMGADPLTTADIADYRRAELSEGAFRCPLDNTVNTENTYLDGGYGLNWAGLNTSTYYGSRADNYAALTIADVSIPTDTIVSGDSSDALANWAEPILNNQVTGNRHLGKLNLLWFDGHVSPKRYAATRAGVDGDTHYYFRSTR
jgi:prepilin-type N-terminal cleavage/methylation domain-containing protein/prepilin-type processing-associated H-X9-DG protein